MYVCILLERLYVGELHCVELFVCVCVHVWVVCVGARVSEIAAEPSAGMIPGRRGSVITQTCLHSKYVMKSCW